MDSIITRFAVVILHKKSSNPNDEQYLNNNLCINNHLTKEDIENFSAYYAVPENYNECDEGLFLKLFFHFWKENEDAHTYTFEKLKTDFQGLLLNIKKTCDNNSFEHIVDSIDHLYTIFETKFENKNNDVLKCVQPPWTYLDGLIKNSYNVTLKKLRGF